MVPAGTKWVVRIHPPRGVRPKPPWVWCRGLTDRWADLPWIWELPWGRTWCRAIRVGAPRPNSRVTRDTVPPPAPALIRGGAPPRHRRAHLRSGVITMPGLLSSKDTDLMVSIITLDVFFFFFVNIVIRH